MKPRQPFVPRERHETVRRELVSLLQMEALNAKEISSAVGIPEKEVYEHLEHLAVNRHDYRLTVVPATCRSCGFVFAKRTRIGKPGKCPVCRSESISAPLFSITALKPNG